MPWLNNQNLAVFIESYLEGMECIIYRDLVFNSNFPRSSRFIFSRGCHAEVYLYTYHTCNITMQTTQTKLPFLPATSKLPQLRSTHPERNSSTSLQTPPGQQLQEPNPREPARKTLLPDPANMVRTLKSAPTDYTTPPFPSLYNPVNVLPGKAYYLYYASDIWRFTLYWTLIIYAAAHLGAVLCAVTMQWRNWKLVWGMPLVYGVIGGLESVLAGSVVGLV